MKKLTTAALLFSAIGATALAQDGFDPTPNGFGFRFGLGIPSDSELRDLKDAWTTIGVDYNIDKSLLKTGNSFLSLDYFARNLGGDGGQIWNIMLGNRFYSNASAGGYNMYFLAGLGAVVFDFDDSEFNFGGIIGAGLELGPNIFFEGRYSISEKVNDINPGFLGLYLGYRF